MLPLAADENFDGDILPAISSTDSFGGTRS